MAVGDIDGVMSGVVLGVTRLDGVDEGLATGPLLSLKLIIPGTEPCVVEVVDDICGFSFDKE